MFGYLPTWKDSFFSFHPSKETSGVLLHLGRAGPNPFSSFRYTSDSSESGHGCLVSCWNKCETNQTRKAGKQRRMIRCLPLLAPSVKCVKQIRKMTTLGFLAMVVGKETSVLLGLPNHPHLEKRTTRKLATANTSINGTQSPWLAMPSPCLLGIHGGARYAVQRVILRGPNHLNHKYRVADTPLQRELQEKDIVPTRERYGFSSRDILKSPQILQWLVLIGSLRMWSTQRSVVVSGKWYNGFYGHLRYGQL